MDDKDPRTHRRASRCRVRTTCETDEDGASGIQDQCPKAEGTRTYGKPGSRLPTLAARRSAHESSNRSKVGLGATTSHNRAIRCDKRPARHRRNGSRCAADLYRRLQHKTQPMLLK